MFGDFMTLCVDQLIQHASKFKFMYGKDIDLPLIIRTPMGGGRGYGPTHSQSIEKIFLGWPGLEVVVPNIFSSISNIFQSYLKMGTRSPLLLIENKLMYGKNEQSIKLISNLQITLEKYATHKILIGEDYRDSRPDLVMFAYGESAEIAISAATQLYMDLEISTEILIPEQISPLNVNPFLQSAKNKRAWIFIEEGPSFGSFSSELHSNLSRRIQNPAIVKFYSNDSIIPAPIQAEKQILPSKDMIVRGLKEVLR